MKITVTENMFVDAFADYGRAENFSREARELLFQYFEEIEDGSGEEMELDPIAVCCDYSEDSWEDIAANYDIDLSDAEDEDEKIDLVREYLENNTSIVGETSDGFVYASF